MQSGWNGLRVVSHILLSIQRCTMYTWFSAESGPMRGDCLLFSGCETTDDTCTGCFTGKGRKVFCTVSMMAIRATRLWLQERVYRYVQEVSIVLVYWAPVYRHIWHRRVHIHVYRLMRSTTLHFQTSVSGKKADRRPT